MTRWLSHAQDGESVFASSQTLATASKFSHGDMHFPQSCQINMSTNALMH